mmetsp:Transcript_12726/g.20685  ORF Transcript_12726/g.20685 Transcript_12726/m.20685 type:complete len:662 (+) Transcript_12726:3619-5604(+)
MHDESQLAIYYGKLSKSYNNGATSIEDKIQGQLNAAATALIQMEKTLNEINQVHMAAQLRMDISRQHHQFVQEKWRCVDQHISTQQSLAQSTTTNLECKGSTMSKLPTEEVLLQEFFGQRSIQQKQAQTQYDELCTCFKSTSAADTALRLYQTIKVAKEGLKEKSWQQKLQRKGFQRQKTEFKRLQNKLSSNKNEISATQKFEEMKENLSTTNEHLEMLYEDSRALNFPALGLSNESQLQNEIGNIKQSLRVTAISLKRIESCQKQNLRQLSKVTSSIACTRRKHQEFNDKLVHRRFQSSTLMEKADLYDGILTQDQLTNPDIYETTLPSQSLSQNVQFTSSAYITNPLVGDETKGRNRKHRDNDKDAKAGTKGEAVRSEISVTDIQRLAVREKQLYNAEQALQQSLNEVAESTLLHAYQNLMTKCQEHFQSYCSKLENAMALRQRLHEMSETRFVSLLTALDRINDNLDHFYSNTVPLGSCYLDYPRDKVSLFDSGPSSKGGNEREIQGNGGGIRIRARHGMDSVQYRDVHSLSGGQKSAVGLALLMSLQQCYSSPFVIMDEVDAALDTSTSCRVGCMLRNRTRGIQSGTDNLDSPMTSTDSSDKAIKSTPKEIQSCQFTTISHRPEMQLWADEIVGLYIHQGFPAAVSICFENEVQSTE